MDKIKATIKEIQEIYDIEDTENIPDKETSKEDKNFDMEVEETIASAEEKLEKEIRDG